MGLAILLAVFLVRPSVAASNDVAIEIGDHLQMSFPKAIERIAIGSPDILDADVVGRREVLLLGKSVGQTTLMIWSKGDATPLQRTVVVSPKISGLEQEFKKNAAFTHIDVGYAGKTVTLTGTVASADDQHRAIELAKSFFPTVIDDLQVAQPQIVSVEVRFAALSVTTLKELGFDFRFLGGGFQLATSGPNSVSNFTFTPGSGLGLTSGLPISDAFNLLMAAPKADFMNVLSALSGTSLAQILAEPTLLVRSGESAEFMAGGEVPVPVPEAQTAIGIEYHRYGIQLRVSATVLSPERIALRIAPEVSDLDFSNAVSIDGTEVPAFTTRSADTTVEMADGKSFVLAGLMSSTQSDNEERIPYLADIPIIGPFFKRVSNSRERQELIIVVTPHLVTATDAAALGPLPGADSANYDPSLKSLALGKDSLPKALIVHGLMP